MTAVFAGPGLLFLFLLSAFIGALRPLPGARESLRRAMPDSLAISMNSGSGTARTQQRSYLLLPHSFRNKTLFVVTAGEDHGTTVAPGAPAAFHTWAAVMGAAIILTFSVSLPAVWRHFRRTSAPGPWATGAEETCPAAAKPDEHAQL